MSVSVYRLYDADDRLLYVGISNNPRVRIATHRRNSPFGAEIVRERLEEHPDRHAALAAESAAIAAEGPIFNRAHRVADYTPVAPKNSAGTAVKVMREAMDLSIPRLAELAGASLTDLLDLERGGEPVSDEWLKSVTDALGKHLHDKRRAA